MDEPSRENGADMTEGILGKAISDEGFKFDPRPVNFLFESSSAINTCYLVKRVYNPENALEA